MCAKWIGVGRTYELLLGQCCIIVDDGFPCGFRAAHIASFYFPKNASEG
jgi:hypothetical protein